MSKSMTRIGAAMGAAILTVGIGTAAFSIAGDQQPAPGARGRAAGPGRRAIGPLAGLPIRELNLTEAQREQIRTIAASHQDALNGIGERAAAARGALHAATASASFDEGLVRARAAELAAVEADLAVVRARIYADALQILTPVQQAKAKELSGSRRPRPNAQR
jgi:Spy/CpxP family protein refolding chaperone